jgi:hypothetical protein
MTMNAEPIDTRGAGDTEPLLRKLIKRDSYEDPIGGIDEQGRSVVYEDWRLDRFVKMVEPRSVKSVGSQI